MFNNSVFDRIQHHVNNTPTASAFCINETFFNYAQLWDAISQIRTAVHKYENERILGLVVHDSFETYAAIFALWFEGKAYIPLHPKQPLERNLEIIAQASVKTVIDFADQTPYVNLQCINKTDMHPSMLTTDRIDCEPDRLAYILFTSGSTGKPKGVQLTQRNITAFIDAFMAVGFEVSGSDRCLQSFDLTFDVSIQSFLIPLIHGACVYTVPHDQIKYSYVYGLLEDHALTFGIFAPSMIRLLRPYFDEINLPELRYCVVTAEASPIDLIEAWAKCIPNAQIINLYGPTEATIYCTYYKVPSTPPYKNTNGMLCIGKPFKGIDVLFLDENQHEVPEGQKGELYIAGDQLTIGYWDNPTKNAESFFNFTHDGKERRFYKTGDLCQRDATGDILYFGRLDYQVKIQGYRIELGEVEFHAREAIQGKNAIAFAYNNAAGNTEMALVLEVDTYNEAAFMEHLKKALPHYMIPAKVITLGEFPLNQSGKIDRVAIKNSLNI